jgi:hypothetical protein
MFQKGNLKLHWQVRKSTRQPTGAEAETMPADKSAARARAQWLFEKPHPHGHVDSG